MKAKVPIEILAEEARQGGQVIGRAVRETARHIAI